MITGRSAGAFRAEKARIKAIWPGAVLGLLVASIVGSRPVQAQTSRPLAARAEVVRAETAARALTAARSMAGLPVGRRVQVGVATVSVAPARGPKPMSSGVPAARPVTVIHYLRN